MRAAECPICFAEVSQGRCWGCGTPPEVAEANPTRIPRCCTRHRLDAFDAIGELLARDAQAAVIEMVKDGWPTADAVTSYRRWALEQMHLAIDVGCLLAEGAQ